MTEKKLFEYLKTQFSNLEGAKKFMYRWANEMDQELPGGFLISSRALAAYCSAVLEGKKEVHSLDGSSTFYIQTKYGIALFESAWADCKPS